MREKFRKIKEKALVRQEDGLDELPKITNENVAEQRERVLGNARRYIYPLQQSKHKIVLFTISLTIIAVLAFTATVVYLLYRGKSTSGFVYQVTKVVPFPVARSGFTFVSYENYLFELRHYKHYYETQQQLDFNSDSGREQLVNYQQRALDEVVNLAYVKRIAKEKGITVSEEEVDNQIRIAREQKRLGGSDDVLEDVLNDYWGWTIKDFRRSLRNELLIQKVTVANDDAAQQQARAAKSKINDGVDFAVVAKEYSQEDSTKDNGGNFGEVSVNDRNVSQQTVDTLLSLKEGQVSEVGVIPYGTGYALEIVKSIKNSGGSATGAHIIIRLNDISGKLNDMKDANPYRVYIKAN